MRGPALPSRKIPTLAQAKLIGLALAAILLAVNIFYLVNYLERQQQNQALEEKVRVVERKLALARQAQDLERLKAELATAEEKLAQARATLPQEVPTGQIVNLAVASAFESGVSITKLEPATAEVKKVGVGLYRTSQYRVSARAAMPALVSFFDRLEKSKYTCLVVDGLDIKEDEDSPGTWRVDFRVTTYAGGGAKAAEEGPKPLVAEPGGAQRKE